MSNWGSDYLSGKGIVVIARENRVSNQTVLDYLKLHGVALRKRGQKHLVPNKSLFEKDCSELRWSALSKKYGVSYSTIKYWRRSLGLSDGVKHNRDIKYKVRKGGCWECTSHLDSKGYPRCKGDLIVRKLYFNKFGIRLTYARHLCGFKWCVNPSHVVEGTQFENNVDAILEGKVSSSVAGVLSVRGLLKKAIEQNVIFEKDGFLIRVVDGRKFKVNVEVMP